MKILFSTGMLIPLTYILLYFLGGMLRPGYSHISNSVSELLSPGAPNRRLLVIVQVIYALLHILFGIGVLIYIQGSGASGASGVVGAWMIVALGAGTIGTAIFPQDAEGTPPTLPGKLHIMLVFGALIPLSILSTLLIGFWFGGSEVFPGFDIYSFVTVGAIIVMGGIGGAMVKSRFAGLVERIAALTTQQWLFVLSLYLVFP